jgi:hypothetical protein
MKDKYQNTTTIYERRLSFSVIVQSIFWLGILLGLESLYLLGSNAIFDSDISYFIIISILLFLLYIKSLAGNKLYWYLRPKISAAFYQNITNVVVIALLGILYFLLTTNKGDDLNLSLGNFGSITLMISLPIVFFLWLSLQKISKDSTLKVFKNDNLSKYLALEPYIYLIVVAIFGILYDFFPHDYATLVVTPIVIAVICVVLDIILNRFILSWTFLQVKHSKIEKMAVQNDTIFELNPYSFFHDIKNFLSEQTKPDKIHSLNILKSFSLIDKIDDIRELLLVEEDKELISHFNEIIKQLEKLKLEVERIENPYEFVEQSSNILLIKALARKQINDCDQNLLLKLLNDNRPSVAKAACIVAGHFNDINYISILINHLENPLTNIYAQFALKNIGEKVVKYLEIEFSKRKTNIFFVESCFDILSAIPNPSAHNLLFISLNEQDNSIVKIAAKKILNRYENTSEERRIYFSNLFDNLIINVLSNHFMIKEISKMNETFYILQRAFKDENKENVYLIKNLLKLYYDAHVVKEVFQLYDEETVESHLLACNLIDLLIANNINVANKIKALFSPSDSRVKEFILEEYPSFEIDKTYSNEEALIWHILNKDYDEVSNWTRASAINTLQYLHSDDIPFELAAEFLNANLLLKQTAAISIYKNIPEFYTIYLNRLTKKEAVSIDFIVRSNIEFNTFNTLRNDNLLLYNKIQFLSSIPYLKELTTNELNTFHNYFKTIVLEAGNHQISLKDESITGYWIVETGKPKFSHDGLEYNQYKRRDIIEINAFSSKHEEHVFFQIDQPVRFLIVEKIILLNLLQKSHKIIDQSLKEISDFSSNISFSNKSKIKVA